MTDQGETFFEDFRLLVRNHIGNNYTAYVLTSGNPSWVNGLLRNGAFPTEIVNDGRYPKVNLGINDIDQLVRDVSAQYKDRSARGPQKLQIILHFLAHGISSAGIGDGMFAIGQDKLSFAQIEQKLLSPLAALSDELIAFIEPCFGGNIAWNLPQNFFMRHNAMVVFGALPWASQWAPSSLDGPSELSGKEFTRSTVTLAAIKALMGYASRMDQEEPVKFAEDRTLSVFAGTEYETVLKEKHVVRVDEFAQYAAKRGTINNCLFALDSRSSVVEQTCGGGRFSSGIFGAGSGDRGEAVKKKIAEIFIRPGMDAEKFDAAVKQAFPIHQLRVTTPIGANHSLNPKGGNGILSIINILEFERDANSSSEGIGSFTGAERDNSQNLDQTLGECVNAVGQVHKDLYEVLAWAFKNSPSDFSGKRRFPGSDPGAPPHPDDSGNKVNEGNENGSNSPYGSYGDQGDLNKGSKPQACSRYLG